MKPIHYILLTITAIIIIAAIVYWDKVKTLFPPATPPAEKSDYEKCIEKHKSMADGEACTNCLPEGALSATYAGVIKNGVCEQVQAPPRVVREGYKIKVSKATGAFIYTRNPDGTIVAMQGGTTIPDGTIIISSQYITAPTPHYRVSSGWVDANDVTLIEKVNLV